MKLLLRYLAGKLGMVALLFAFALVFAVVFALYRLPLEAVLYPAGLCLVLGAGCAARGFLAFKKRHTALEELKKSAASLHEQLPAARDAEADDYRELYCLLAQARRGEQARAAADFKAMNDYYTLWAHQIKTPIASMRLKLHGQDSAEARSLLADLNRVEHYVEMVLTYLRLEGDGTDYVIRVCELDGLLRSALKHFSGEFISRGLRLDYAPTGAKVLTDEKWLGFVIEQVLSNALKYTREGGISVYMEDPLTLCIKDTGIGIAAEDLPRVFDQSYTGLTGRESRRASGLGLYLCKRVCDELGHGISIDSKPGEGTTVRIDLGGRELDVE